MKKNANARCKCVTLCAMLSDYVDDELSPSLCRRVERHLSSCEDCRRLVETLRGTVSLCQQYTPDSLDPAVAERSRAMLLEICRETRHEPKAKQKSHTTLQQRPGTKKSRRASCS